MEHPETHKVTLKRGPRPAGKPDECFYCQRTLGSDHAAECVMRLKTVVVRATVEYVVIVPESWTKDNIEFHRNDSSWCADNMLAELERVSEDKACICHMVEFAYLRDATTDDEENRWAGFSEEDKPEPTQ